MAQCTCSTGSGGSGNTCAVTAWFHVSARISSNSRETGQKDISASLLYGQGGVNHEVRVTLRSVTLTHATKHHALELMSWFPTREEAAAWGGPALRYPFAEETFLEDIYWSKMPAWVSTDAAGKLTAFGQYYARGTRCHLARLIVSKTARGRGFGREFIDRLMRTGQDELASDGFSLFVMSTNRPALRCYRALAFRAESWPADVPMLQHCVYLERERL